MIKILKHLRKEKGLYLIVTEIDAKAADITAEDQKDVIEYLLEAHLTKVSENVENEFVVEHFKEFLIETVFTHYVDIIGILNYIHNIRNVIRIAETHQSHSKFVFTTEFKNYIGDESNSDLDKQEEEEEFVSTSFKINLLKKDNLEFVETVIFSTFNAMYREGIIILKPKKVNVSLKDHEESIYINMTFDGQTK